MIPNKNLLPSGPHYLVVEAIFIKGGKLTFRLRPIASGFENVLRTWVLGSPGCTSILKLFGVEGVYPILEDLNRDIKGRTILGFIEPAKKPNFVNLRSIYKIYDQCPKNEVALYLTGFQGSFNRENTSEAGA